MTYSQKNRTYYKVNYYINYPQVRLVDQDSRQIGVMSIEEARQKAQQTGLDLVEINPNAKPPVIKLIEFSKFKYQEEKKKAKEKKKIKGGDLKEIKMTPFIGDQDYQTRLKKATKFLTTGNKVKLSIKFQGRQIQKPEFGYQLVERFKSDLSEFSAIEGTAKLIGKRLIVTFGPVKKVKINNEKSEPKT